MSQEEKIKEFLGMRRWKDFLESLPCDGVSRTFSVRNPNDLMIIRVRAAQLKKTTGREYSTSVDFGKLKIAITSKPRKDVE